MTDTCPPLDPLDPYGDLLARLQGPNAARQRAELLSHLRDVEAALVLRTQQGAPLEEFSAIEAGLLAVRAGIVTLQTITLPATSSGQTPLTQPVEFFKGEAA